MSDLRLFLLQNIHWYKPCAYQKILLTRQQLRYLYGSLPNLAEQNEHICGIKTQWVNSAADRRVILSVPDEIPNDEALPIPAKEIYTEATLGLIGSTLVGVVSSCKGKFQKEGNVDKSKLLTTCRDYYDLILDYHRPTKVIGRLTWGFELAFLYAAARREIPCVGLIMNTRKMHPPHHWDKTSRWMYAFLTEAYDKAEIIRSDNSHTCKLELINRCDVCMFHHAVPKLSSQMNFTQKTAQSSNKLTLDITNDWLTYIKDK